MPERQSTVRLSVADNFSQPLAKYAQGMTHADAVTAKMSASLKQAETDIAKLARSTTPVNDTFQKLQSQILPATAILVGFGVALKQAFEAGQEGAEISQTRDSFATMLDVIGAAPDLLERLRTAARGTIDDMTLMSSVQLLLAGTSGDLASRFAEATPQLLEMALAARKINPSLGDTQFLFDSIARGIKRSSPLILDNLGIVVKLGPAYKEYAESIGKATDELTAEDKQLALLNAVLAKSDTLMKQAGGSTQMAGEEMAQLATNAKSAAQELKENLYPAVENVATALNVLLFGTKDVAAVLAQHEEDVRETAETYEDYIAEMFRAKIAAGDLDQAWVNLHGAEVLAGTSMDYLLKSLGLQTRAMFEARSEMTEAEKIAQLFATATQGTARQARGAGDAYDDMGKRALGAGEAFQQSGKQIGEGATAASLAVGQVLVSMRDYNAQLLFNQVAANLSAEGQLLLASQLGLVDNASLTLMAKLPDLTRLYDENKNGVIDAGRETQNYVQALLALHGELDALDGKTINTYVNQNYQTSGYNLPPNPNTPIPDNGPYFPSNSGGGTSPSLPSSPVPPPSGPGPQPNLAGPITVNISTQASAPDAIARVIGAELRRVLNSGANHLAA